MKRAAILAPDSSFFSRDFSLAQCAKYCVGCEHSHLNNVSTVIICQLTTEIKCPQAVTQRGPGLSAAQRRLCCAHFHLELPFGAGRGAVIKAASISSGCARGAVAAGRLIRPGNGPIVVRRLSGRRFMGAAAASAATAAVEGEEWAARQQTHPTNPG